MSYVQPTTETFKVRFPEFSSVGGALIDLVIDEAVSVVGDTWLEKDRARAQMLLVAHNLSMEGEPQRSASTLSGETPDNPQQGAISSIKVGDVDISYSNRPSQSNPGTGVIANELLKTSYGVRYLEIMKLNFRGPVAI
jgi:hypothetical protein